MAGVIDENGNRASTWGYDSTGVPAATRTFGYDTNGYQNSVTDWKGNLTTMVNDSQGQPTRLTEASGTSVARTTTTYMTNFHLPQQIANAMQTITITPDANGNTLSRTKYKFRE
jgi:hypothetical protein